MIEQFKSYFAKLERLSCAELDRSAEKLVVAENGNIAKLIAHIAEMSARKLALKLGCVDVALTHILLDLPADEFRSVAEQVWTHALDVVDVFIAVYVPHPGAFGAGEE